MSLNWGSLVWTRGACQERELIADLAKRKHILARLLNLHLVEPEFIHLILEGYVCRGSSLRIASRSPLEPEPPSEYELPPKYEQGSEAQLCTNCDPDLEGPEVQAAGNPISLSQVPELTTPPRDEQKELRSSTEKLDIITPQKFYRILGSILQLRVDRLLSMQIRLSYTELYLIGRLAGKFGTSSSIIEAAWGFTRLSLALQGVPELLRLEFDAIDLDFLEPELRMACTAELKKHEFLESRKSRQVLKWLLFYCWTFMKTAAHHPDYRPLTHLFLVSTRESFLALETQPLSRAFIELVLHYLELP